ncbi:MAG: hypothetical protein WCB02_24620 [Bradyrhizobium sp.]
MSAPASTFDHSHYEQACDQAISMCDGNLRSTIKALIMANEYLEVELLELQAAISSGCMPKESSKAASSNPPSKALPKSMSESLPDRASDAA